MMTTTEAMLAILVPEIRLPVVVNRYSTELRQDADVIHSFFTSLLMNIIISEGRATGDMQPLEATFHP